MKKTLISDLNSNLDEVSRGWIRKPATIILSLVLFIIATPIGICWSICWKEFTVKCWKGTNND